MNRIYKYRPLEDEEYVLDRIYGNSSNSGNVPLEELRGMYELDPMSVLKVDKSDARYLTSRFTKFLSGYAKKNSFKGYVIGLSGGIDSCLAAMLAVKAVGKDNVYGMLLPSKFTSQEHNDDALKIAAQLGIRTNDYKEVHAIFDDAIDLTMRMTGISEEDPKYKLLLGNNHARERMKILRGKAASLDYLVLGTTNLTEAWLGYATIAGDGYKGIDVEPIQQLPKTSERMYSRLIGIPENIITKAPTAGLWEGQTDEGEIGMTYENIDRLMAGRMLGLSLKDIVAINKGAFSRGSAEKIVALVKRNDFKAKPEPHAELGVHYRDYSGCKESGTW